MKNSTSDTDFFQFSHVKDGAIISQDQLLLIEDIYIAMAFLVSFAGTLTNALNCRAFVLIGKEDGVSISLLFLSLSDFGFCISGVVLMLTLILRRVESTYHFLFPMDPWVITVFTNNSGHAFYAMTSLTTTFLAVARCMCVAKPLQFNAMFTRSRAIVIHTCFVAVSIGGYVPLLAQMRAEPSLDAGTNGSTTRLVLFFSDKREEVKDVVFLIFDTVLTFICQGVLIVCVSVMANSLRQSAKFRQSAKSDEASDDDKLKSKTFQLSGKELKVIQQVVLISSLFIVCALPKIVSAFYSLVEPEFDLGKRYTNIYLTTGRLRKLCDLINSSSTFFIYYKYNSRFRELYFGPKID